MRPLCGHLIYPKPWLHSRALDPATYYACVALHDRPRSPILPAHCHRNSLITTYSPRGSPPRGLQAHRGRHDQASAAHHGQDAGPPKGPPRSDFGATCPTPVAAAGRASVAPSTVDPGPSWDHRPSGEDSLSGSSSGASCRVASSWSPWPSTRQRGLRVGLGKHLGWSPEAVGREKVLSPRRKVLVPAIRRPGTRPSSSRPCWLCMESTCGGWRHSVASATTPFYRILSRMPRIEYEKKRRGSGPLSLAC